jgi:AraC-like DNA-binding protein
MQDSLVQPRSRRSGRAQTPGTSRIGPLRVHADATCSVRVILPFARYFERIGGDSEALLRRHGLTMEALHERDLRVPHGHTTVLLKELIELSGDPAIGVRAARCDEPGDFDVVEYAAANCATIGEALRLAARFFALMHDGMVMELVEAKPLAALRVRPVPGLEQAPAGIEFLFASLLAYGSRSVGHATRPLRVEFTHQGPADTRIYEETFREVRFGCDDNAMWVNAAALDVPHCSHDRSLLQILTTHADGLLRQLSRPPRFAERARAVIGETLLAGGSGADQVARRLAVSSRTLHRRLAEEGTSHGELVDDVRREQAMLHLAGNRFSIGEISFLLGFAHPNGFHKAFKRWTRMTPAQYREEAQSKPRQGQ